MVIKEISDISYLLPSLTKTELESTSSEDAEGLFLDYMAIAIDYQKCIRDEEYMKAADAMTRMISLLKEHPLHMRDSDASEFILAHAQRAYCYVMAKDYEGALPDLQWIGGHCSLYAQDQVNVLEGLIQILQEKDPAALQGPANKGNRLALLLLNEPENLEPPKTDWLMLPTEHRIQKLLEGRHYEKVIEEIDRMDLDSYGWTEDDEWIALRGVCYALRGNYLQAINDYKGRGYFPERDNELAVVYVMAGQKERALKSLTSYNDSDMHQALLRDWIEKGS